MGQDNTQKMDIWAHDIYLSLPFEQAGLVDLIIDNTYRYIKDIIAPYSIIVTRRKTTKYRGREAWSYDLLPAVKNYSELNEKILLEAMTNGKKTKFKNIVNIIGQNTDIKEIKTCLSEKYSEQKIKDDMLLFKLYKDQIKDNQTIIITDKYSAGYFKSLQETTNDLFIMDINSTRTYLRPERGKNDQDTLKHFTKLEKLIAIPIKEGRWTLCAVRLSWFDEFIGSIGIIFNDQPSHKSFREIIAYLHAVKRNYSEEIMKLILKDARKKDNSFDNFMDVIHQCIGSVRIILLEKENAIEAYWNPFGLIDNKLLKIFQPYFDFEKDDFKREIALPVVTISEKKLLPILLKNGNKKFFIFLETKEEYTNDYEKLKNMAEQNIWKLGWLWRNYNDIKL